MIESTEIRALAKKIIQEEFKKIGISIKKLILFGSQAMGTFEPDSDWDFLVCINDELAYQEKAKIIAEIQNRLAQYNISVDIIVKSEVRLNDEKTNVGYITYYAMKNGVAV